MRWAPIKVSAYTPEKFGRVWRNPPTLDWQPCLYTSEQVWWNTSKKNKSTHQSIQCWGGILYRKRVANERDQLVFVPPCSSHISPTRPLHSWNCIAVPARPFHSSRRLSETMNLKSLNRVETQCIERGEQWPGSTAHDWNNSERDDVFWTFRYIFSLYTQLISLSINIGNNTLSLLSLAGHPITHKAFRIDYKDIPYRPIYI